MFRRKRSTTTEPTPPAGRVRPEDAVLDELSRAFGQPGAALDDDVTSPADVDPLATASELRIVTELDGTGPVGRGADVSTEPHHDRRGEPGDEQAGDPVRADEGGAGDSGAIDSGFGHADGPPPAGEPPARRTISIGADDITAGTIDAVSLDEALGRPGDLGDPGGPGGVARVDETTADGSSGGAPGARGAAAARATIPIGDDFELPDAVYLDDELHDRDPSGADSTVFIDDDGTGDAIAPKDATARGIEPRIRQRRIGVRRAAGRRRLKWVVLAGVLAVLVIAALTVLGSGLFAIDDVSVGGNVYTDEERLDAVIDDLLGTPVLLADTDQAEADLEAIPWVEDARVRTKFPDRATIEIRERSPVATMRGADGLFRVLDAEGRVLDVIEGQPVAYVLIAGPGTLDLAAGEFAPVGHSSAAALVTKLTPTVRPLVESLEVTADGSDLVLNLAHLDGDGQSSTIRVRFGSAIGDSDQIEKLVRLERKLDDLPDGVVSVIDVSTDEVTVR